MNAFPCHGCRSAWLRARAAVSHMEIRLHNLVISGPSPRGRLPTAAFDIMSRTVGGLVQTIRYSVRLSDDDISFIPLPAWVNITVPLIDARVVVVWIPVPPIVQ